jgi:hypothetical protein
VAQATLTRTLAHLRRRGVWFDDDPAEDKLAQNEPGLAAIASQSISGTLRLARGERSMDLFAQAAGGTLQAQTPGYAFNVHAGIRMAAYDRAGRERICRYVTRPELSVRRVTLTADGDVRLTLKRTWSDGRRAVTLAPLDFMARLAAMVWPPRMHRTRYHGLWAPHAARRKEATPAAEPDAACEHGKTQAPPRRKRYDWAALLARVFAVDVLQCPRCHTGRMQKIAVVVRADAVRAILESVGFAADSPKLAPARLPEQGDLLATD